MDANELMELDEASLMRYIEAHIRINGRMDIVNIVAADSNRDFDILRDSDSSDKSSVASVSDDDDNRDDSENESDDNEEPLNDQRVLGDMLPILDRVRIHDRIDHHNIHCPPFNDMSTVFRGNPHGICDCDDFCFAMCVQDNNFEYFKTANYVIDFNEVLMKAVENVDSEERRSNSDLRKSLYRISESTPTTPLDEDARDPATRLAGAFVCATALVS